jgi:hypothetical protein
MTTAPPERVGIEFEVENERYPFVGVSADEGCRFELEELVPRGAGAYSEFFRVENADSERVLDVAASTPHVEPSLVANAGDESLFEFRTDEGCIAVSLAEAGAYPRVVSSDSGTGQVVAECSRDRVRDVVPEVLGTSTDVEVVGEAADDDTTASVSRATLQETIHDVLSQQRRDAVLTALSAGFYDWPETATLEDVADALDVAPSALDARLRDAERTVLAALFEDGTLDARDGLSHPFSGRPETSDE